MTGLTAVEGWESHASVLGCPGYFFRNRWLKFGPNCGSAKQQKMARIIKPHVAASTATPLESCCHRKPQGKMCRGISNRGEGSVHFPPALSAFLTHSSVLSFPHRGELTEILQYADLLMATEDLWLEHSAQWLEHVNDHHMTSVGARELELHFISDTNNNVLG